MSIVNDELLTQDEAAKFLRLKPGTLATWRSNRRYDLRFIKVGRHVKYRRSELERFLDSRTTIIEEGE